VVAEDGTPKLADSPGCKVAAFLQQGSSGLYDAPEVRTRRGLYTEKSEVWCLGATLLCLLTGEVLLEEPQAAKSILNLQRLWTLEDHVNRTLTTSPCSGSPATCDLCAAAPCQALPIPPPGAGLTAEEKERWDAAPQSLRDCIAGCLQVQMLKRPTARELCTLLAGEGAMVEHYASPAFRTPN
jgi:hypothetical protein